VKSKAQGFSNLAIAEVLTLPHDTPQELRDIALICVSMFTGLRMQDLHRFYERNVECLQMEGKTPRRYKLTMEVTKTNRGGVNITLEESVVVVPCICMEGHDMDTPEGKTARKAFLARVKKQFDCACESGCPYALLREMQAAKPEKKSTPSDHTAITAADRDLPFARGLASRGEPREMTRGPLGINELRKIFTVVNARLPTECQLVKAPSGHSGRRTYVSNTMNAGARASSVAASSKHKSMEVLNGYIDPDDGFLCEASRIMGGAVLKAGNQRRSTKAGSQEFAESESETEEEEEEVAAEADKENNAKQPEPRANTPKKRALSSKRAGTPAPSKTARTKHAGTPVVTKSSKAVTWASDVDSDSPETKRRTAHNGGGGGSSSGYKNSNYNAGKAMEESEDEEDEGPQHGQIHIHLHMGGKKGKR
jgi:hypothetical protein